MEKTDLKKILSISGESGLFRYLAQAKAGLIAESLLTGQRKTFGQHARVSAMSDISIYTMQSEVTLREVFERMSEKLSGGPAPSSKSDAKQIAAFFSEVIPDYDADRFYFSHMKKVLDWYNCLHDHATLDFEDDEAQQEEEAPKPEA